MGASGQLVGGALESAPRAASAQRALAVAQGSYFLATGVWPLVHMPSFLRVTGPKADLWLVRAVGALIAVTGATLLSAGARNRITPEIRWLAAGSAAALAAIDVVYTARREIPPVYMLDGAAEAALAALWAGLPAGGDDPRARTPASRMLW